MSCMLNLKTFVALGVVCFGLSHGPLQENTIYSITAESSEPEKATIEKPLKCSPKIGRGGNLREKGKHYKGKCEGSGLSPEIGGTHKKQRYLLFKTLAGDMNLKGITRSELAITSKYFPFDEKIYVGFRIMIPEGVAVTNQFFYVMQMWQCAGLSPIAGVRLDRGSSHTIEFMTRGDSRSSSMMRIKMEPSVWYSFIIKLRVDPEGKKSEFQVWSDKSESKATSLKPYGFKVRECSNNPGKIAPQHFRLKFGIYKGNGVGEMYEGNKYYEIRFDDIRVGNYFKDVRPW